MKINNECGIDTGQYPSTLIVPTKKNNYWLNEHNTKG